MEKTINILIIAELKETQSKIVSILKDPSHNIIIANTKKEATEIINKQEIGIIIVDIALKKMSPSAFIRSLRLLKSMNSTYTIILSSTAVEAERLVDILKEGAVDYITHPFKRGLILAKVNIFKQLYFKQRSVNHLLQNILPESVIGNIENQKKPPPKKYESATVLFIDIVGFSKITKKLTPMEIVNQLDTYFQKFDEIIRFYGLEKIKTIGDAYLAVSGVPEKNQHHALSALAAAYAIQRCVDNDRIVHQAMNENYWEVRIGLHSGPLVGGVIGNYKFTYDIWGQTVNTAKRLEGNSEAGKINISQTTHDLVEDHFKCHYRGQFPIKHGDAMEMYFVEGIQPNFQASYSKYKPNKAMRKKLNLSAMDFAGFETEVINRLKIELDENLHYHDLSHTLDVEQAAKRIGKIEGVEKKNLLILQTAALIHDAGFILKYDENEELGFRLMIDLLEKYGYTKSQINQVHQLVVATKIEKEPEGQLQKIICDADHDYLGRDDYYKRAKKLYRELNKNGVQLSKKDWLKKQINYLENKHQYYTNSSQNLRENGKQKRIEELKEALDKMER